MIDLWETAVTRLFEIELFGLSGGPLAAVSFVTMAVLLLVYAGISGVRRRRELERLLPALGFHPIEKPDPAVLVTDDLFYPNGFESQGLHGGYGSIARIPMAWSGRIGEREVVLMDVAIRRSKAVGTDKSIDRTVIRCMPPGDAAPPDFMIHEWILFKDQIRGARAIGGPEEIGQHYYLFSDAPDEALVPWITAALRQQLEQYRLWRLAAHDGVFYLSRDTVRQRPSDMPGSLAEAEALLDGLMREAHQT
ncbi:MAG: hypothetical protein AAGC60_19515 [Acidobacteriota bacterium]